MAMVIIYTFKACVRGFRCFIFYWTATDGKE